MKSSITEIMFSAAQYSRHLDKESIQPTYLDTYIYIYKNFKIKNSLKRTENASTKETSEHHDWNNELIHLVYFQLIFFLHNIYYYVKKTHKTKLNFKLKQ